MSAIDGLLSTLLILLALTSCVSSQRKGEF